MMQSNRRRPDKMQWLLVWLMGMVATGTGYQIIQNQANAVTRQQVNVLIEEQKKAPQQWQIDAVNDRLDDMKARQDKLRETVETKIPQVTIYKPLKK